MNCNKCGKPLAAVAKFCPYCGNQIVEASCVSMPAVSNKEKKSRINVSKLLIITAFMIPICIIAVLLPMLLGGNNSDDKQNNRESANIGTLENRQDNDPKPQKTIPYAPSEEVTTATPTLSFTFMPASESQISADIQNNDSLITNNDFWFDSMHIVKRQTDIDSRTDRVFVEWTVHNNVCSIQNEGEILYELYNEGWLFENMSSRRLDTTILSSDVSSYDAEEKAKDGYIPRKFDSGSLSLIDRQTNYDSGEDVFVYEYKVYFYYCTKTYTARVKYKFGSISWYYDSSDWNDGVSEWEMEGDWKCRNQDAQIWVRFDEFSDDGGKLEYKIKYRDRNSSSHDWQSFYTDGPVDFYCSNKTDSDNVEYLEIRVPSRNASNSEFEPGYLRLYPSQLRWKCSSAKDQLYILEMDDGAKETMLSELETMNDEGYDYFPIHYNDPNGDEHYGLHVFSSYNSMYRDSFEGFCVYELDDTYSLFSGKYYCDEKMTNETTISLYIYADDVCIYSDEHLAVGDGVHPFSLDISSASSSITIMVITDDESFRSNSLSGMKPPTIVIVDAVLD